jgi:DNA-directed RNA polymerase specialized sigma24 family protein
VGKQRSWSTWVDDEEWSTYADAVSEATKLAAEAGSKDPSMGLRAVAALRELLERLEALQVGNARSRGWSWQEIAEHLGVSKQAVHKKYARRRVLRRRGS